MERKQSSILYITIYKPPQNCFIDDFTELLSIVCTAFDYFVITVDLNVHLDVAQDKQAKELIAVLKMFGLTQHVSEPTHSRGHTLGLRSHCSCKWPESTESLNFSLICDPYSICLTLWTAHWIWHFRIGIRPLLNVVLNRIRTWFFWMRPQSEQPGHLMRLWRHSDPRCTAPVDRTSTLGETPPLPEASQHLLEIVSLGYFNIVRHEDLVHSFAEVMHNSANGGLCDAKQVGQGAVTRPHC